MTSFPGGDFVPVVMAFFGGPVAALLLSTVLACALTPLVIAGGYRLGWLAYPRSDRWATRTVALMGGIAIVTTMLLMLVISGTWNTSVVGPALGLGMVVLAVLGAVDDRGGVSPGPKLLLETCVAAALIAMGVRFAPALPPVLSVPLTWLWIIGVTNAMNLLDNMDGLAAGTGALIGSACGLLSLAVGDTPTALLSFGLAGACFGYLPYNYRRARVFMGDTGSLPLGLVVATLSLLVAQRASVATGSPAWGLVIPVLLCALPIVDTTLVTISRLRSGRAVSQGGRDHASHRLVYLGFSDTAAVACLHGAALVLAGFAIAGTVQPSLGLLLGVAGAVTGAVLLTALLRVDPYAAEAARAALAVAHIQPASSRNQDLPVPEVVENLSPHVVLVRRAN